MGPSVRLGSIWTQKTKIGNHGRCSRGKNPRVARSPRRLEARFPHLQVVLRPHRQLHLVRVKDKTLGRDCVVDQLPTEPTTMLALMRGETQGRVLILLVTQALEQIKSADGSALISREIRWLTVTIRPWPHVVATLITLIVVGGTNNN